LGDGPNWNPKNPKETMFSLYSTSPVGIMGAIVDTTDVKMILRLNCNKTDFYATTTYPTYLYYNPYPVSKNITYHTSGQVDVFDIVAKKYMAKAISGDTQIPIPPDQASILVEIPAGSIIEHKNNLLVVKGITISYK
jgi:hypothetical protein